ncbi:MAG: hypothetical protein NXI31_11180 [bacterium]|nr:hypothetical protein [bacterium]
MLRSFRYDYRRHEDGSFVVGFACAPCMSWRCGADGKWREFD